MQLYVYLLGFPEMYCIQFGGSLRPKSAAPIVKVYASWQQPLIKEFNLAAMEMSLNEVTGQIQFLIYSDSEDNVRHVTTNITKLLSPFEAFIFPENRVNVAAITALHEAGA